MKSIVVTIDGLEAVPVRAVPFFFGFNRLPPDLLVDALAGNQGGRGAGWDIKAHALIGGGGYREIKRGSWQVAQAALKKLEESLHCRAATDVDEQGYAEWLSQSPLKLPSGTFILSTFTTRDVLFCFSGQAA